MVYSSANCSYSCLHGALFSSSRTYARDLKFASRSSTDYLVYNYFAASDISVCELCGVFFVCLDLHLKN